VAEVDESDGSFARVAARVAIVTNLDAEHLRHYGSMAGLEAAFNGWLRTVPADGLVIVPAHGLSERVTAGLSAPILSVGLERGDVQVVGLEPGADGSRARLVQHGHDLGPITVAIPGVHMVLNAAMASVAARFAAPGVDLGALATCERVRRRFTVHGHVGGVRVVEDYGHHPTEVRATIAAARLGGGQVRVVFQPHRHTRTADCFAAFTGAFDQAHRVAFLPIYGAGEDPIPGVTSEALAESIIRRREADPDPGVLATCDRGAALAHALSGAQPGDTLLLLGAGDVGHLAQDALHASVHR
jgi:UDP-N-acetylmuramate--alanine ligase